MLESEFCALGIPIQLESLESLTLESSLFPLNTCQLLSPSLSTCPVVLCPVLPCCELRHNEWCGAYPELPGALAASAAKRGESKGVTQDSARHRVSPQYGLDVITVNNKDIIKIIHLNIP